MKKAYLFFLPVVFVLLQSFGQWEAKFRSDILGDWYYKCSTIDSSCQKLDLYEFLPVEKMSFKVCDDKNSEARDFPDNVQNMRASNLLRNISCTSYNNEKRIEICFPVAHYIDSLNNRGCALVNYCNRSKWEYRIRKLNNDTLIVSGDRYITIGKQKYSGVEHIYTRIK